MDSLGYLLTDQLLKVVGRRLMKVLRQGDLVARYSEYTFAILLEHLEDELAVRRKAIAKNYHFGSQILESFPATA